MSTLNLDALLQSSRLGGPAALGATTNLQPAAGQHSLIAPARYVREKKSTYVFEDRFIEGAKRRAVLVDSKSSIANRMEESLRQIIREKSSILSQMPSVKVTYRKEDGGELVLHDYTLPHRLFDAHVRLGSVDGVSVTKLPAYRDARNCSADDALPIFEISPVSLVFGVWDSTRKNNQVRFPSVIVGEIIGIIDEEGEEPSRPTRRSGARLDPIGARVQLSAETANKLAQTQAEDMSAKTMEKIAKQKGFVSASNLGLGAIPPGLDAIDGIATTQIIRSYSLSFSTLRRLRFGKGVEGDVAIRALLAAIGIVGMVGNDSEMFIRANCHLIESAPVSLRLDRRGGQIEILKSLSLDEALELVESAYQNAVSLAGINWHGQVVDVVGNPEVLKGAQSSEEKDEG